MPCARGSEQDLNPSSLLLTPAADEERASLMSYRTYGPPNAQRSFFSFLHITASEIHALSTQCHKSVIILRSKPIRTDQNYTSFRLLLLRES